MVKVGIIGATGYAGAELVRILLNHKEAQIEWFGSRSYIDENYADIYRNFFELVDADCLGDNICSRSLMTNVWMITWMSLLPAWM